MERRHLLAGFAGLAAAPVSPAAPAQTYEPRTLAAGPEALRRLGERLWGLDADGLDPRWYGLVPDAGPDPLLLSRAAMAALTDLVQGRVPALPGRVDLRRDLGVAELPAWTQRLLEAEEPAQVLEEAALRPAGMATLRAALVEARQRAAAGWPSVPTGGRVLDPGQTDPVRVPALRARLAASDPAFAVEPGEGDVYDPGLLVAVRRFQAEAGLDPDGRVGPATLAALNRPPERVVDQIRVAMDMRRGAPPPTRARRVEVNVPDYRLRVIEDGRVVLEMAVVVGRPARATPMITTRMTAVQFNPPWGVPQRNAEEDMLPRLRRDPRAFAERGFRVFQRVGGEVVEVDPTSIDWSGYGRGRFPYFIRQDAGDANALGRLKFIMPNNDDIFLHDTPERHLFRRVERAHSSGCIRLERPMEFLLLLLDGNPGWDEDRARRLLDSRRTVVIPLRHQPPIRLHYDTVVLDGTTVRTRQDIYGLDLAYARAMERRADQSVAARG